MKLRATIAILAACAALTACSDDGDDGDASSDPTTSSEVSETPTETEEAGDPICDAARQVEIDLAGFKAGAGTGDPAIGYETSLPLVESLSALEATDVPADIKKAIAELRDPLIASTQVVGQMDIAILAPAGDKMTAAGNKISEFIVATCT